jgi:Cu-Zn family superoxide dismutase
MRKWSVVFGAALVASVLVAGCGKKEEEPVVQNSETATEAATPAIPASPPSASIAAAQLSGPGGATGVISFTAGADGVHVVARVEGAPAGVHGFHLHAGGSCEAPDFKSAGDHFNPANMPHGAPNVSQHHAGDFGNIEVAADGTGHLDLVTADLSVSTGGANDVIGKAVILHGGKDDLTTQPSGNAGPRIACGVVQTAEGQAATDAAAPASAPAGVVTPASSPVY